MQLFTFKAANLIAIFIKGINVINVKWDEDLFWGMNYDCYLNGSKGKPWSKSFNI